MTGQVRWLAPPRSVVQQLRSSLNGTHTCKRLVLMSEERRHDQKCQWIIRVGLSKKLSHARRVAEAGTLVWVHVDVTCELNHEQIGSV
jgi:hypothetical protein